MVSMAELDPSIACRGKHRAVIEGSPAEPSPPPPPNAQVFVYQVSSVYCLVLQPTRDEPRRNGHSLSLSTCTLSPTHVLGKGFSYDPCQPMSNPTSALHVKVRAPSVCYRHPTPTKEVHRLHRNPIQPGTNPVLALYHTRHPISSPIPSTPHHV
jgi:hypothetical protein